MNERPVRDYQAECDELREELSKRECMRIEEVGRLKHELDVKERENELLKAKVAMVELIFSK